MDIPGWTLTGVSGGVWNINANPSGYFPADAAPEGNQIGFLAGTYGTGPSSFSQVLSATLANNTLYTLTGEVGHPSDQVNGSFDAVITVELLAGTNVLASMNPIGPQGSFAPFTLTFNSGVSAYAGLPLQIVLSSNQPQSDFDNLALDGSAVPLPPTVLLLASGLLGLGLMRQKRSLKR